MAGPERLVPPPVTVSTNTLRQSQLKLAVISQTSPRFLFKQVNLVLLGVATLLLLAYISLANRVVAEQYSLLTGRAQLAQADAVLAQQNTLLASQNSLTELTDFAHQAGLVEIKEYTTLFADDDAATAVVGALSQAH